MPIHPSAIPFRFRDGLFIQSVEVHPLNASLKQPFEISSATLDRVENCFVRVDLMNGNSGWGEIPTLHPVTKETQPVALKAARFGGELLEDDRTVASWMDVASDLEAILPEYPAVRTGLEMAMIDALTRSLNMPLYQFFNGIDQKVVTDITIPICEPGVARGLAARYSRFATIKTKVGRNTSEDIARLKAIMEARPHCTLILDANEGFRDKDEASAFIDRLHAAGIYPDLLEQPLPRDDFDGMAALTQRRDIDIAADESCRSKADVSLIAENRLADCVNIKLVKQGIVEAMGMVALAQVLGLRLMIGGMVETRLGMGFAAHFAAGMGGFHYCDLDTPYLLKEDPIKGGCEPNWPVWNLKSVQAGHGMEPR